MNNLDKNSGVNKSVINWLITIYCTPKKSYK